MFSSENVQFGIFTNRRGPDPGFKETRPGPDFSRASKARSSTSRPLTLRTISVEQVHREMSQISSVFSRLSEKTSLTALKAFKKKEAVDYHCL